MRTHARQHLGLEVRHKNSHGRIHTLTYQTDRHTLQARTYKYARMYPHADTHLYPNTFGCTHAHVYIQCRPRSDAVYCDVWSGTLLIAFTIIYYYLNKKSAYIPIIGKWSRPVDIIQNVLGWNCHDKNRCIEENNLLFCPTLRLTFLD